MLFDEYRKILDFEIFEFNFDELNSGTMKLAEFMSYVNSINDSEINYLAPGKVWDKVVKLYNYAMKALTDLQKFKDVSAPQDFENKFANFGIKIEAEEGKREQEISKKSRQVEELLAKFLSGDTSAELLNFDYAYAFAEISDSMDVYLGEADKQNREYFNYVKVCELWKSAFGRIQDVKDKINKLLEVKLNLNTYKLYIRDFDIAQAAYAELNKNEKCLITEYKKFREKYAQLESLAKKEQELEKLKLKRQRSAAIAIDWVASVWIVAVLVGLSVGFYFLAKTSWYFTAPEWCLFHKVHLWSWHHWGSGAAFGVTDAMGNSDIGGFWQLVLWLPCIIVDLLVYVLQAIWWLLAAISWPLRWLLSRIAGLLLYALAYGLTGIAAVAACVFIGLEDFTMRKYWGCRVTNILLCVGIAVVNYVLIYAF